MKMMKMMMMMMMMMMNESRAGRAMSLRLNISWTFHGHCVDIAWTYACHGHLYTSIWSSVCPVYVLRVRTFTGHFIDRVAMSDLG
jgi:hypothetical protein